MSVPSGALISRVHYSPIYLSCVMLLVALSWQYLSTVSKATEEYVHTGENWAQFAFQECSSPIFPSIFFGVCGGELLGSQNFGKRTQISVTSQLGLEDLA